MSCFKNPRFVKELAYRTMVNYYLLRDYVLDTNVEHSSELQHILDEMSKEHFDITMKYEVTLALNSMLGLLILPQQEYYSESISSCNFSKLPTLMACIEDESYKNSYNDSKDKPALVIKHMRNAVAHNRLTLFSDKDSNKDIKYICFRDAAYEMGGRLCAFSENKNLDNQIEKKSVKV